MGKRSCIAVLKDTLGENQVKKIHEELVYIVKVFSSKDIKTELEVINLYFSGEYTAKEIANKTNYSEEAINKKIKGIIERVHRIIKISKLNIIPQ